jgi:nucleotide-binding universal stress UspA family protein
MKRLRNILLASMSEARDSEALDQAASLAKENEAPLTVVEIMPELSDNLRNLYAVMQPLLDGDPEQAAVQDQLDDLTHWVQPIRDQGIPGEVRVLVGSPWQAIADELVRNHYDLVVFAAEPKRGWRQWLFGASAGRLGGSTLDKVLDRVDCPVLIVRSAAGKTAHRREERPHHAAV